jgi:hypothetical protein
MKQHNNVNATTWANHKQSFSFVNLFGDDYHNTYL